MGPEISPEQIRPAAVSKAGAEEVEDWEAQAESEVETPLSSASPAPASPDEAKEAEAELEGEEGQPEDTPKGEIQGVLLSSRPCRDACGPRTK